MNQNDDPTRKVSITIEVQNTNSLVEYLLAQNIPFLLTYEQTGITQAKPHEATATSEKAKYTQASLKLPAQARQTDNGIFEEYLKKCLSGPIPAQEEMSEALGMSLITIRKKCKEIYGVTFYQICLQRKMEYAAKLLKKGHKANEICKMIGYGEKSAIKFNKMFQKHFGITPKKYQLANRMVGRKKHIKSIYHDDKVNRP